MYARKNPKSITLSTRPFNEAHRIDDDRAATVVHRALTESRKIEQHPDHLTCEHPEGRVFLYFEAFEGVKVPSVL